MSLHQIPIDVLFEGSISKDHPEDFMEMNLNEKVTISDYINFSLKRGFVGWTDDDRRHVKALMKKIETKKDKDRVLHMIRSMITMASGKFLDEKGKEKLIDKLNRYSSGVHFFISRLIHRVINSKSNQERKQHIHNLHQLYKIIQKMPVKN